MSLKFKILVTEKDLEENPDLAATGAQVGDEIEVTAESTKLVGPRPSDR